MSGPWEKYRQASAPTPAVQDGPWSRYEAAALPVVPEPPARGVSPGMSPEMAEWVRAETAKNTPEPRGVLGNLQLGAQAVGSGAAGVLGLPVDLTEAALNAGLSLADLGLDAAGFDVDLPRFGNSVGSSNQLRSTASDLAVAAAGPDAVITRDEMSPGERIRYDANRFGTEALLSGGALATAGKAAMPTLAAPYTAPGSIGRVLAGDTGAGVGAGASMAAYDEYVPEEAQGPIGRFLVGLLGGIGGATGTGVGKAGVEAVTGAGGSLPARDVPLDPTTNMPYRRRDVANAGQILRDEAGSVERLETNRRNIEDYLVGKGEGGAYGPGADPTTGLITNDPSMLTRERRDRATNPAPYIERDREVMSGASDRVQGLRSEKADAELPGREATAIAAGRRAEANRAVEDAQTAANAADAERQRIAADVSTGRTPAQASTDLDRAIVDETFLPRLDDKNARYRAAGDDPNVVVRTENTRAAADAEAERMAGTMPSLRDPQASRIAEDFRRPQDPAPDGQGLPARPEQVAPDAPPVVRPLGDVMNDRTALSAIEQEARRSGNQRVTDTARNVRSGINADIEAAAKSGVPGTEKLAEADRFYREDFAPLFRQEATKGFFKDLAWDRARQRLLPENTGKVFLNAGDMQRAAAEDLARIIDVAPNRAGAVSAATDYAVADAVASGIIRDGVISETALARWVSKREGMLSALPEVRQRFDDLLSDVRSGNAQASELRKELDAALKGAKLTERDISKGALSLAIDTTPDKMVSGILSNRNPPARMRELIAEFDGNPEAVEGLKAAVTDFLIRKVSTASKAGVNNVGDDTISLTKLRSTFEDNRSALAEIYTPDEMQVLNQVQSRLELMSRRSTQASAGSATAENRPVAKAISEAVGQISTLMYGALLGGSYERRTRLVLEQFPDATAAARRLIEQSTFDPALAKHLMEVPTNEAQMYTWNTTLNRLLVLGEVQSQESE